jgi:hypothetical protein
LHTLRIDARVLEGDRTTERMPDDADRTQLERVQQVGDVQDEIGKRVVAAQRPAAVPVTPQVGSDHVEVAA